MHGSGPPLDPYPRDDAVVEAPLRDTPPSPARSKASRSNSPGSFELDDFLEKDEAYRAIMSETMGDGLAQNFLFDDSPPRQPSESPPRQEQPPPQQRTFNGKQPPAQKPPPPDYVDDARPPRTAAEATRRAASLAARYHGVVADDLLPEGEAPEVYAAAIAGAYRDQDEAAAAARPRYATRSRDRQSGGGWAAPEPRPPPGHASMSSGPAESGEYSSPWSGDDRGTGGGSSSGAGSKGRRGVPQVQRRRERNQREQKRSNEISSQIDGLRRVLTDAGVAVKASKSAILVGTAQYIQQLQRKHEELEAERRRMLSEMCVLLQQAPRVSDPPPEPEQPPAPPAPPPAPPVPDAGGFTALDLPPPPPPPPGY